MVSSRVINAWRQCLREYSVLKINQMRFMEEQWWVDVLAPRSMVDPSTLFLQENNVLSASLEVAVPRQHIEDLESILLTQPADPIIMKWLMGDSQFHGHGDIQSVQGSTAIDTVMFEQDSWSLNQHQPGYRLGCNSLNGQIPHQHTTFSSPINSSISLSPSSLEPNSDPNFLHISFTSLVLCLPSHSHETSLNSFNHTVVTVPSIATPIVSVDGPGGHSFSAPSSFVPLSPNAPVTRENHARSLLVGNSISEGQLSHRNTCTVHQTRLVMEEVPVAMESSLSCSPLFVHALHVNLPCLAPAQTTSAKTFAIGVRKQPAEHSEQNFLCHNF